MQTPGICHLGPVGTCYAVKISTHRIFQPVSDAMLNTKQLKFQIKILIQSIRYYGAFSLRSKTRRSIHHCV